MIVSLATITITYADIELPDRCPRCQHNLTEDITQWGYCPYNWYGPYDEPYDCEATDGDSPTDTYVCPNCQEVLAP